MQMKNLMMLGGIVLGGALVASTASAQVKVNVPGSSVNVGKGGVKVKTRDAQVNTGEGGTDVQTDDAHVTTGKRKHHRKKKHHHKARKHHHKKHAHHGAHARGNNKVRDAIKCGGDDEKSVKNVVIEGKGPGVIASGGCDLTIRNSVITSSGAAVIAKGKADVKLINCVIKGKHALDISGQATVSLKNSQLTGKPKVSGQGDLEKDRNSVINP